MLSFSSETLEDVLCLEVTGRVDAVTSAKLSEAVMPALQAGGKVLLRCGGMNYISSAGLRILLVAHKTGGARLALSELTGMALEVVEVSGFDELFKLAPTKEAGLELLRS